MIARSWKTEIDVVRSAEYDAFAQAHSRPMFALLPGCLGALFLGTGETRIVLSLWVDRDSIAALDSNAKYRETVAAFQSTGILRQPQSVELFEVTGGTVNADALMAELSQASKN